MDVEKHKNWKGMHSGGGNAVYGLGFIGALIYYIQNATNFMDGVIGFLKALVWPAFLIHKVFTILGM
jgi:hypothetical protein